MATHAVRLKSRNPVAEGTMAFHFEKPVGFAFRPGQALDVVLKGQGAPAESGDARHAFSIVAAPFEDELVITTRLRDSAYKRALGALPVGAGVEIDGPFGSLVLHKNASRAAVLIAGGIGVTPFMSMVRQAARDGTPRDILLLYSNHWPEDAAFLAELQRLQETTPGFRLVATMTAMERSIRSWSGHKGRIDSELVKRVTKDLGAPIFYVAGPPGMVEAMRQVLIDTGVDEDDVRSEEFHGY